ncbi:RICIN domain-containing protein [Streptomyces sp. NPDC001985]|uniref:RICIN domain-containing protein n=1 Tax=Streptomyces sp. NPDC001985 TaxID=3154406 RepID=UPI003334A11D
MTRHRRLRTALITVNAVAVGWLTVPGAPATAGTAQAPERSGRVSEEVSPRVAVPAGIYQIKPRVPLGTCLRAGPQSGDTGVYVGSCDGTTDRWRIGPTAASHGPEFMEARNLTTDMCLDAFHLSGDRTGRVDFFPCSRRADQAWDFRGGTSAETWACVASSPHCDLVLRVGSESTAWGGLRAVLGQITSDTSLSDRRWKLYPVS